MRTTSVVLFCLFVVMTTVQAQAPSQQKVKEIRTAYAKAKQQAERDGKDGQPLRQMKVVLNEVLEDEDDAPSTTVLTYHFDDVTDSTGLSRSQPYFVREQVSTEGQRIYRDILFDKNSGHHLFTFARFELSSGNTYETRYYWDADGKLLQQEGDDDADADYERTLATRYRSAFSILVNGQ